MSAWRLLLIICITCICVATTKLTQADNANLSAAINSITTADMQRHVDALANDTFEGREAGSRGGRAAGVYLGQEFRRLGLSGGAADGGYYQSFGGNYRNLLGILEGSDPELKSEYIVVSAHYDHVGYGTYQNSYGPTGFIHNGADDNASGTAGILEVIEGMVQLENRPRRSILFALWDAEEKGLLGSKHWLANPTVPLDQVEMMVNMDMIGRLRPQGLEVSGTRTGSGFRQLVGMQNRDTDLLIDFTWKIDDNSDHYPFYERGIPILMLHTGLHDEYHRPSDDAHLINSEGMQNIGRLLLGILVEAANRDALPEFRSAARREMPYNAREFEQALPPLPSRLGIRWSTEEEPEIQGVRIQYVTPGSPAAEGGLLTGDVLTQFNGEELSDGEDLREAVFKAAKDSTVVLTREGEEEPLEIPVVLDGSPMRLGIAWRTNDGEPNTVLLSRVVPGSPAAVAGLQLRDRVYRVNGQPFDDATQFAEMVTASDNQLSLLVERQGKLTEISVDLPPSEAPEASQTNDSTSTSQPLVADR